jgi:hypothetical protein
MKKRILAFVFVISLASCSTVPNRNFKYGNETKPSIVGIWAMLPLRNGIANVAEFTKDGKSNLYSFNCRKKWSDETEPSTYTISNDGKNIRLDSNGEIQELSLISISENEMVLGQKVGGNLLKFSYIKVSRISPLCFLYKESKEESSKRTAFEKSDFTPAPWIPNSPNIERYAGKWADEKGIVQIEVNMDVDARYRVFHENDENWNYLYNDVSWSGSELHFQSFAYSDKRDLFDHPYHKSKGTMMLTPTDDFDKIKWSFFIGDKRFDYILSRKLP